MHGLVCRAIKATELPDDYKNFDLKVTTSGPAVTIHLTENTTTRQHIRWETVSVKHSRI